MEHNRKLVHVTRLPIRWGDMDALGHVNNTVYFRYMEQARIEWFEALGLSLQPGGEGPLIINASCTFLKPMVYPATVELRTYVDSPGRSSVQSHVRLSIGGELYAEGAAKIVWTNGDGKSAPIPDELRAALQAG